MINLEITKRTDPRLLERMKNHYSQPRGFVGRNICYAVMWGDLYYGHIVAGSATRFLKGRNEFLGIDISQLNQIVNNVFYNVSPIGLHQSPLFGSNSNRYPCRNFTSRVVKEFERRSAIDWLDKYGDTIIGYETLVEKPRTGSLYKRAGWEVVGETIGYSCKREAGTGTDSWTGKRVWITDKDKLRPKIVLCKKR